MLTPAQPNSRDGRKWHIALLATSLILLPCSVAIVLMDMMLGMTFDDMHGVAANIAGLAWGGMLVFSVLDSFCLLGCGSVAALTLWFAHHVKLVRRFPLALLTHAVASSTPALGWPHFACRQSGPCQCHCFKHLLCLCH